MSGSDDKTKKIASDQELDDLLNSALEDFDKPNLNPTSSTISSGGAQKTQNPEELWNDEFIASQAKLFEEKMAAMFGGPGGEAPSTDEITLGFQKMAEAAAMAVKPDTENVADPQFTQTISEALKGLNQGQETLQSPFNTDDIARMFGGIDLEGAAGAGGANQFLPFMQGMMQSLLSAEVLLPSLKDLVEKYPKYLSDNKDKIEKAEYDRYTEQLKLMQVVCAELEQERPDDSAEVKKERFHKVIDYMQKMQDLGQPPIELVGDVANAGIPQIDPSALNDPSQCCVM